MPSEEFLRLKEFNVEGAGWKFEISARCSTDTVATGNSCSRLRFVLCSIRRFWRQNCCTRRPHFLNKHQDTFAIRGLQFGSGQMNFLGPEIMNEENNVWVSINYRLNASNTCNQRSQENFVIRSGFPTQVRAKSCQCSHLVQGLLHKANSGLF